VSLKFGDLIPRLKNTSRGSKPVKDWFVVGRAEGVQCLYFRDWEKCFAPGWDGSTDQDSILFPANTVLVVDEREFPETRFKNPSERV
jgi:hypothetical protein